MTQYAFYEYLLYFVIYSVLGWALGRCIDALRRGGPRRAYRLCRGPWLPSVGVAAVLLILFAERAEQLLSGQTGGGTDLRLPVLLLSGLVAGGLCFLGAALGTRLLSGQVQVRCGPVDAVFWALGGVLLLWHFHPLLCAVLRRVSPWIHLVVLLVCCSAMISQCVDGVAALLARRRGMPPEAGTVSERAE